MKKSLLSSVAIIATMLLTGCASDEFMTASDVKQMSNPNRVPVAEALQKADALMAGLDGIKTRGDAKRLKSIDYKVQPSTRSSETVDTAFYLVNYHDGGYAILGADRRLDDVYAISDTGSLHWKDGEDSEALEFYFSYLDELAKNASINGYGTGTGVPINPPPVIYPTPFVSKCSPRLKGNFRNLTNLDLFYKYYDNNGQEITASYLTTEAAFACMLFAYSNIPESYDGYNMNWGEVETTGKSNGLCNMMRKLSGPYDNSFGDTEKDYKHSFHLTAVKNRFALQGAQSGGGGGTLGSNKDFCPAGYYYMPFDADLAIQFLGRTDLWHDPNILDPSPEPEKIDGKPFAVKGRNSNTGSQVQWIIDGYIEYKKTNETTNEKYLDRYFHCLWGKNKVNDGYFKWTNVNKFSGNPDEYDDSDSKECNGQINVDLSIDAAINPVSNDHENNN